MNKIIVLRDKKGFEKIEVVREFPPHYDVPEVFNGLFKTMASLDSTLLESAYCKSIRFIPKSRPENVYGQEIMVYVEL